MKWLCSNLFFGDVCVFDAGHRFVFFICFVAPNIVTFGKLSVPQVFILLPGFKFCDEHPLSGQHYYLWLLICDLSFTFV